MGGGTHMHGREAINALYKIFIEKYEGSRPRCRWKANVSNYNES